MSSEKSVTVRFRKYVLVEKTSPEPIRPEDITIDVTPKTQQKNEVSQPNFLALCILWAHFQACHQSLLQENQLAPWETFEHIEESPWTRFLKHMITDSNWPSWMTNPAEVKERSIVAYNMLQITDNSCANERHDNSSDDTSKKTKKVILTLQAILHRPITAFKTLHNRGKQLIGNMVRKITSRNKYVG